MKGLRTPPVILAALVLVLGLVFILFTQGNRKDKGTEPDVDAGKSSAAAVDSGKDSETLENDKNSDVANAANVEGIAPAIKLPLTADGKIESQTYQPEMKAADRMKQALKEGDSRNSPAVTRAPDFPFNLETFDDWQSLSAEDLQKYRRSMISRIGRVNASTVGDFFYRVHADMSDPEAKKSFRESILGVWCAKDVDGCLSSIEENFTGEEAFVAKRDALAGWAAEDWMTARQFLQTHGDKALEDRLGGDSSRFVGNVVAWMVKESSAGETEALVSALQQQKNIDVAQEVLKNIRPL